MSFLAMRSGGKVSDFIDVTAEGIATLNAFRDGIPVSKITLAPGEFQGIGAFARGASGAPLAGALVWGFSTSDSDVVVVSPLDEGSGSNEVSLTAVGPGSATLTIRTARQSLDVPVTVDATK